ncbi:MAG: SCO family protein [Gammaproteobacteria bacterium]
MGVQRMLRMRSSFARATILVIVFLPCTLHSNPEHDAAPAVGPADAPAAGYGALGFAPPQPGTYALPPLGQAGDGKVIDSGGATHRLHDLLGDRIVVLSFIYSSCSDVNGCPLATFVLSKAQTPILDDMQLRDRVRFISLSFDPVHDTPKVMAVYGGRFAQPGIDWRFLTTASESELASILDAYDQWIGRALIADGRPAGKFTHLLRVFLIDQKRRIRNIYSTSFLHPDTLLSDLRTLSLERE